MSNHPIGNRISKTLCAIAKCLVVAGIGLHALVVVDHHAFAEERQAEVGDRPATPEKELEVVPDRPATPEKELEVASQKGLDLLREIALKPTFKETFRFYGFDSPEQASNIDFTRPLRIYWVRLERLKQFSSGDDAEQLLERPFEVIYPVKTTQGKIVTSITITASRDQKTWKASRFGDSSLIRGLTEFPQYKKSHSSFLVRIPGLNLYFFGDHNPGQGQLLLTPVADHPEFHWRAGQTLPAQEIFLKLVSAARSRGKGPG